MMPDAQILARVDAAEGAGERDVRVGDTAS